MFNVGALSPTQTSATSPKQLYAAEKVSDEIRNFNKRRLSSTGWEETASGLPRRALDDIQDSVKIFFSSS